MGTIEKSFFLCRLQVMQHLNYFRSFWTEQRFRMMAPAFQIWGLLSSPRSPSKQLWPLVWGTFFPGIFYKHFLQNYFEGCATLLWPCTAIMWPELTLHPCTLQWKTNETLNGKWRKIRINLQEILSGVLSCLCCSYMLQKICAGLLHLCSSASPFSWNASSLVYSLSCKM